MSAIVITESTIDLFAVKGLIHGALALVSRC